MKLLKATFKNFRILQNVELTFSSDSKRRLTVIRAENETGKTTALHGLQWALYGDSALPNQGTGFRLHPLDWTDANTNRIPIVVSVDYEVVSHRQSSSGSQVTRHSFRLVRTAYETLRGTDWTRSPSEVKLFELRQTGAREVPEPESQIREQLPADLREVFFTDGDRALSFIEADVSLSTKRDRVQRAVRSLLGLVHLEAAHRHLRNTASASNRKAKKVGAGDELADITDRLSEVEDDIESQEGIIRDANDQLKAYEEKIKEVDDQVTSVLQKGDRQKLGKDLQQVERQILQLEEQMKVAARDHSELFKDRRIAIDLLSPVLAPALRTLEELQAAGKIPSTTIPVLQERLEIGTCICGETLDSEDSSSQRRAEHIQHLIEVTERADQVQRIITEVYFGMKNLRPTEGEGWVDQYSAIELRRSRLQEARESAGRKYRGLEDQIDALPDTDVQGLRDLLRQYRGERDQLIRKHTTATTERSALLREQGVLQQQRDKALRSKQAGSQVLAELEVTQDLIHIIESTIERITNEELRAVSSKMNEIFLEMIGADPAQGALIASAEISPEFDILVYGPAGRRLNPDRDLNGASRRALTIAFILALTKVSEVEAPNIIDTPLGMMSGFVKRAVLSKAICESSQLILFLTPSEIQGCEDIIDREGGAVYTLTNTAHYPTMLVNPPESQLREVVRCGCNHRSSCAVCERRKHNGQESEFSSIGANFLHSEARVDNVE